MKLKKIISLLLCISLTVGLMLTLFSCQTTEPETPAKDNSEKVTVVRAIRSLELGAKLQREDLQEALVDKNSVPEGAAATIKEVANKFLKVPLVIGDIILPDKISDNMQFLKESSQTEPFDEYVFITDYELNNPMDMSEAIQRAIDENPNKTIYFPDGLYRVAKPIKTSADPDKAVSLRFSTYAIVTAGGKESDWEKGSAVFELGATGENKSDSTRYSFKGGVIDNSLIKGISAIAVKGGDAFVNNVSVKQAYIGLVIDSAARADVEDVVIYGSGTGTDAIGVIMNGEESTLTNMRICEIDIGVKLTGANNVLRNIHPLAAGNKNLRWSTGFYDTSSGNFYDVCYSDQFAIGFYMGPDTKSVYNGCYCFWFTGSSYGGITPQHFGFYAAEQFNSIIRDCRVTLQANHGEECVLTYLRVESGAVYEGNEAEADRNVSKTGNGVVVYPRGGHENDDLIADWEVFCRTDKLT